MKRILLLVGLAVAAALPAQAADYVFMYEGGYLAVDNGDVVYTNTFSRSCVWTCVSNTTSLDAATLGTGTSYWLYTEANGTRYWLMGSTTNGNAVTVNTNAGTAYWRTNGDQLYYYRNYNSYYLYYRDNEWKVSYQAGSRNNYGSDRYTGRSGSPDYRSTTTAGTSVAQQVTSSTVSTPTITPGAAQTLEFGGSASYTASATGTQSVAPAHTTFTISGTTYYFYNNQTYNNAADFAVESSVTPTYTWSLSGDGASALTLSPASGNTTTVAYTSSASSNTATLTVTATVGTTTRNASVTINVTPVEPTAISATGTTVYMGNSGAVAYTLTPDYAYHRVSATSGNTDIFTVSSPSTTGAAAITPVAPGEATLTLTALNSGGSNGPSTTVTVTVRDICAAPEFSFAQSGSSVVTTITTTTPGATIRYTTDGTDPTPTTGNVYSDPFTSANGQIIKAIVVKGDYYDPSAIVTKNVNPIDYVEQGVSGGIVTLNDLEDHTWTYYSGVSSDLDGGNYNTNYLGKLYSPNPRNVKITYKANGGAVSIDESDTQFVYYKTLEESATTGEYAYQVISNPFSKRPNGKGFGGWKITSGADYIKDHSANDVLALDEEIVFNNLSYASTNCVSAEIVFEATWVTAKVTMLSDVATTGGYWGDYQDYEFDVTNGTTTYENNFLIIDVNYTATITTSQPVTIMMVEPNGSSDYRGTYTFTGNITPNNNGVTKIEFARWNSTNTVNANYNNLWIGRGMTTTSRCANLITGVNGTGSVASPQYSIKVESGVYQYFDFYKGHSTYNGGTANTGFTVSGSSANARITIGNDYDRASGTNTNLEFIYGPMLGYSGSFSSTGNRDNLHTLDLVVKSGSIGTTFFMENTNTATYLQGGAGRCMYLSSAGSQTYVGTRNVTIEGGDVCSIGGGIDSYNNNDDDGTNYNRLGLNLRIKGGTIHGNVYGGAAKSPSGGNRVMVMTGGTVKGWFAAGCNGTDDDGGQNYGTSYVYIGGKGAVDSDGSTKVLGYANGGNVYAAGAGRQGATTCGEMTFGSNLVIADDSYIERGIYGGGNYGYALQNTNIYIMGGVNEGLDGTVNYVTTVGGLYGGANQQNGPEMHIYMNGGEMRGGVYGGCNTQGTISGNVTMQINGGQVGTTTQSANIHGGGYGSATAVSGNVDLTLGKTNATSGVTVYGDVYGGSADGSVNDATSDHTYVTLNAGTIYGSLYGGGLGITNANCNVNGPVQVVVNGGSVKKQSSGSNPASIFGCNNAMGSPKSTVTVTVNKTDTTVVDGSGSKAYAINGVYGGGNLAHYNPTTTGDYPTVTINGCTSSIKDVYGGGNAAAVPYTNVTINGGDIDRVFAGGNGESGTPAHVGYRNTDANPSTNSYGSGNTNATINGGSINQVFGGSNANGVIRGSINVSAQKSGSCDLKVKALYGGGNQAPSNAGNISIGCMTAADMIDTVYGGSNDADISGDISLTMTGGRIGNLFGGNNTGHSIDGDISVEVNWSGSCSDNYLGNVFGGGNMAAYSGGPSVSVLNGTVSGSVYGGGKGSTAVVTGNPTVAIGDNTAAHCAIVEGNVYGGGDAAAVSGKSHVTYNDNNAASRVANLFGGGNAASVSDSATVDMTLGQVTDGIYGGCNSSGSVGAATVNLTGGQVGTSESRADIFGGGFGAATTTTAGIDVNVGATTIHGDIYGGSALGSVNASTTDITTVDITGSAVHGKVYGGGKGQADATDTVCATSHGQAIVNIKTANADLDGIYGGANINGLVEGDIEVNVTANTACAVFGGGFGALTATDGDVTVNIGTATGYASAPTISGNVYGGSALGSVNGSTADTTTVNILNGHITGHVFGGGLGHKTYDPDNKDANGVVVYDADSTAAIEKGNVVVNIGSAAQTTYNDTYKGYNNVTVDGMVFGGNDSCGTPLGDVYVNIYHTAHTAADQAHDQSDVDNPGIGAVANLPGEGEGDYALSAVYGGGNLAHYAAAGKKATVHIYGCENTIEYAYGGGNAADVPACELTVEGGDYFQIFGGGNGAVSYLPGANVTEGDATTNVYGGVFTSIFGGSNTKGDIAGEMKLTVDQSKGSCGLEIVGNLYGGGNKAPSKGGNLTVECGEIVLGNVYGGANAAYVDGDVTLTMKGGKDIGYVFGGSRSVATENHIDGYAISGDVTLRLYGGTITNAFGGSDSIGNIKGNIKVLLIDSAIVNCPLKVDNVYGGGKDAAYAPADGTATTPAVNVLHGTVNNAVFGGGLGAGATVTANPTVTIGDADKAANHAIVGATKIAGGTGDGNVFGGGSQADVLKSGDGVGNTTVTLTGQADVMGNVYGGGNEADVEGNSKVEMK